MFAWLVRTLTLLLICRDTYDIWLIRLDQYHNGRFTNGSMVDIPKHFRTQWLYWVSNYYNNNDDENINNGNDKDNNNNNDNNYSSSNNNDNNNDNDNTNDNNNNNNINAR